MVKWFGGRGTIDRVAFPQDYPQLFLLTCPLWHTYCPEAAEKFGGTMSLSKTTGNSGQRAPRRRPSHSTRQEAFPRVAQLGEAVCWRGGCEALGLQGRGLSGPALPDDAHVRHIPFLRKLK